MVSLLWGWVFSAAETLPVGETGKRRGQAKSMQVVRAGAKRLHGCVYFA